MPILGVVASSFRAAIKAGYIANGYDGNWQSDIRRLAFQTDVLTLLASNVGIGGNGASFSDNGKNGYFTRSLGSSYNNVNKLSFFTNALSTLSATIASDNSSSMTHANTAGYSAGGYPGYPPLSAAIRKFVFSTETSSVLSATLTVGTGDVNGFNSLTNGFVCLSGSNANKLSFSNDTISTITSAGTMAANGGSLSDGSTAGYQASGTNLYKWTFSSDTISTAGTLTYSRSDGIGLTNTGVAGYFPNNNTAISKWNLATSASTTISAVMPSSIASSSQMANV